MPFFYLLLLNCSQAILIPGVELLTASLRSVCGFGSLGLSQ